MLTHTAKAMARCHEMAKAVPCPRCHVRAGLPCVLLKPKHTRSGNMRTVAIGPHHERLRLARGPW